MYAVVVVVGIQRIERECVCEVGVVRWSWDHQGVAKDGPGSASCPSLNCLNVGSCPPRQTPACQATDRRPRAIPWTSSRGEDGECLPSSHPPSTHCWGVNFFHYSLSRLLPSLPRTECPYILPTLLESVVTTLPYPARTIVLPLSSCCE
jgi:hypothetical protein